MVSRRTRVALAWSPAVLYAGTIWFLSSRALQVSVLEYVPLRDRGAHFVEYFCLALSIAHAVRVSWPQHALRAAMAALWMTLGLGLTDELHQLFVPGRTGDVLDWLADGCGALLGVLTYALVMRLPGRRTSSVRAG